MVEETLFPFFSFENKEEKRRLALLFAMHESVALHHLVRAAEKDCESDTLPSLLIDVIDQMITLSTSSSIYQRKGSIEKILYFIQLLWEKKMKETYQELLQIKEEFTRIRRVLSSAKELPIDSSYFLNHLESLTTCLTKFVQDLFQLIKESTHDENIIFFIQKYREDLLAISGPTDLDYLPWDSKAKAAMKENYEARGFYRMIKQHKELFFEMFL